MIRNEVSCFWDGELHFSCFHINCDNEQNGECRVVPFNKSRGVLGDLKLVVLTF